MTAAHPSAWLAPPSGLVLGSRDVHVWRLPLAQPPDQLAVLARTLGPDEQTRAARFYFDRDRNAYTATRGALRTLAGHYAGHAPEALIFGYQDRGKPYLATPPAGVDLNVSHSGDYALLAFTRTGPLGVDVERKRPLSDLPALAKVSFSPHEYAAWCRLPPLDQPEAFFAVWSRKEAFIKATGEGVSQLADFDVSVRPDEPARLLRVPAAQSWWLGDLPAIEGHAAAIVVAGADLHVQCWDWPPC
jgi:4'-phosphopantetheinyl transferase